MSLSRNHIKLITSLRQKKYRLKHKLFVAEGVKVVEELLNSNFEIEKLFVTEEYKSFAKETDVVSISALELKKISQLKSPNKVLGLFKIPVVSMVPTEGLVVALDDVNDPGNLGTIIRLCDWFGVAKLVCSQKTVDCFNQKVVQASMGSLSRVSIVYQDLISFLELCELPTFIADMDGENVYQTELPKEAVLIMGNEANGISDQIRNSIDRKVAIPRFGAVQQTESLNVATATAILLSEFKR